MIGLDTDVIVRLLVADDATQHAAARRIVSGLTPDRPGFMSMVTVVEVAWVLGRSYAVPATQLHDLLDELTGVSNLRIERTHLVGRAITRARAGADFADALIGEIAHDAGCSEVVTFDRRAAQRLGWRDLATGSGG